MLSTVVPARRRRRHSGSLENSNQARLFARTTLKGLNGPIDIDPPPRPKSTPADERPTQRRRQLSPSGSELDDEDDEDNGEDGDEIMEGRGSGSGSDVDESGAGAGGRDGREIPIDHENTNSAKSDFLKNANPNFSTATTTTGGAPLAAPVPLTATATAARPTRPLPASKVRKMASTSGSTPTTANPHNPIVPVANPSMLPVQAHVARGGAASTQRRLYVILEQACLEAYRISSHGSGGGGAGSAKGKNGREGEVKYTLLNCDDHQGILAKTGRDIADARPDITHQVSVFVCLWFLIVVVC